MNVKLLAVLVAMTVSGVAQAASPLGQSSERYIGVKAGQIDIGDEGDLTADKATSFGVYGGVNFDNAFGVEAEYAKSSDADVKGLGVKGTYNVEALGAFGTYRYGFSDTGLFAKAKIGVVATKTNGDIEGVEIETRDGGLAAGLGMGYMVNDDVDVQVEYSMIASDRDASLLTLGANYKF